MTKVSLELGGKSAAIVLDDADPQTVASGVRAASLSNSGQICNALTRILVPQSRASEFTEALAAEVDSLAVGDPTDSATQVGPLVAQRQQQRVAGYIERGAADGARVVTGGTGTFGVNQGYTMDPFAPFGGVKASGYGRELGQEGIDGYTGTESISVAARPDTGSTAPVVPNSAR